MKLRGRWLAAGPIILEYVSVLTSAVVINNNCGVPMAAVVCKCKFSCIQPGQLHQSLRTWLRGGGFVGVVFFLCIA